MKQIPYFAFDNCRCYGEDYTNKKVCIYRDTCLRYCAIDSMQVETQFSDFLCDESFKFYIEVKE